MKNSKLAFKNFQIILFALLFTFCAVFVKAQSTSQSFPTAITSNEISGTIAARDIGDARLTSYFYAFSGNQGDVFINVQTSNFNGDIDIFTAGNLKPLSKITIYADDTNRETGRVVYLRQPSKLILRIEGRSPNDDAATFTVKFAGSFESAPAVAENADSKMPEVKSENQSDVRVNSVGTILEVKPKPQPSPKETVAKREVNPRRKKSGNVQKEKVETREAAAVGEKEKTAEGKETVIEEKSADETANNAEKDSVKTATPEPEAVGEKTSAEKTISNPPDALSPEIRATREKNSVEKTKLRDKTSPKNKTVTAAKAKSGNNPKKVKEPNPLENVHLIILLKDGTRVERAMSEVVKVGVDKGVLTVVANDGSIKRYPILDVAKMTIE